MVSSFRRWLSSLSSARKSSRRLALQRSILSRGIEQLEARKVFAGLPVADLALSNASLAENLPGGSSVGALISTTADNSTAPIVYSFQGGPENLDNEQFFLTGDTLMSRSSFDFESQSSYQVSITATDEHGFMLQKTFMIDVQDVAELPAVGDDEFSTAEDASASGNVLVNDIDGDGAGMTATLDQPPANGTVELNPDGSFTYTPNTDFSGSDSFTYVCDGGDTDGGTIATVKIDVCPVNDNPVAGDDAYSTDENTPLAGNVLENDSDVDGDTLSVALGEGPTNGTLELNADGTFTYTPNAGYSGEDSFSYMLDDGNGGTAQGVVSIAINALNDNPVAGNDAFATDEDLTLAGNVLENDSDADGDTLSVVLEQGPTNGTVELNADGTFTYTPNADYHGEDSFTYMLDDANGGKAQGVVSITINPVNDNPAVVNDGISTDEDVAAVIPISELLANDADPEGESLSFMAAGGAVNGTVAVNGTDVVFTPAADFNGTGSFTYAVQDSAGGFAFATVTVSVNPVADAPRPGDDAGTTAQGMPLTISAASLLENDSDPDGDAMSMTAVGGATGGTVSLVDGDVIFTPNADFTGSGKFHYVVSDGTGNYGLGTVAVEVTPEAPAENTPPVIADDVIDGTQDTTTMIAAADLLANVFDADGDLLTIAAVGDAVGGIVSLADGQVSFQPEARFVGSATFNYNVEDGRGGSSEGVVTVNVATSETETPPVDDEVPVGDELPPEGENPAEDEAPVDNELPETPVDPETPVEDELPPEGELPTEDEAPIDNELPVEDETPTGDEQPTDEQPAEDCNLSRRMFLARHWHR